MFVLACASKPSADPNPSPSGPEPVVFVEAPPDQARPAQPRHPRVEHRGSSEADRALAKQLYGDGVIAFEAGDFAGARGYFEQAYALAPLPALLFNIAHCSERLGELAAACDAYVQLGSDPEADDHMRQAANDRAAALGC